MTRKYEKTTPLNLILQANLWIDVPYRKHQTLCSFEIYHIFKVSSNYEALWRNGWAVDYRLRCTVDEAHCLQIKNVLFSISKKIYPSVSLWTRAKMDTASTRKKVFYNRVSLFFFQNVVDIKRHFRLLATETGINWIESVTFIPWIP